MTPCPAPPRRRARRLLRRPPRRPRADGLVAIVSAVFVVEASLYSAVTPLLPTLADKLSLGDAKVGILAAAYPAGLAPGALLGAWLAPRVAARITGASGLVVLAAACLAFGFADTTPVLVGARLAGGVAAGCLVGAGLAWLVAATPRDRRGAAIGTAFGASILGTLGGPLIGMLAAALGTAPVFGAMACVVALLAIPVLRQPDPLPQAEAPPSRPPLRLLAGSGVATAAWLIVLVATCYGAVQVIAPLRADRLGGTETVIGTSFLVAALAGAAVAPLTGRAIDRWGILMPVSVALGVAAPLLALLAVPSSLALLVLLTILTVGGPLPAVTTPAAALLFQRAEAIGLPLAASAAPIIACYSVGGTLGGLASAVLADRTFDAVPLWLLAGASLLTIVGLAPWRREAAPPAPAGPEGERDERGASAGERFV